MPRAAPLTGPISPSDAQIRADADPARSRTCAFALLARRGQSSKVLGGHAVAVLAASSRFLGHAYIGIGAK
jgi:hypothetical protein